jgi:Protein of unknown function (DUF3551)
MFGVNSHELEVRRASHGLLPSDGQVIQAIPIDSMVAAMRHLLLVLGILVGTVGIGTSAQAQNYPWCALYSDLGGENCGFSTLAQCMATVSGIGGFCVPNTQYVSAKPSHKR